MKKSTIIEIISILFVLLFLYAGIGKLMQYHFFKVQIGASPVLKPIAPFIAWFLPLSEIIVAVLLLIPVWRLRGLYGASVLMILLTGYVIALLYFSELVPCCINVPEFLSWKQQLLLNSLLLVLAVMGIILQAKQQFWVNRVKKSD
jgi:uncharacterized membrane protein YphA (DoxX/SURF4 family)